MPGDGATWVVAVHGQNGRRKAELKILPVVHELGLPFPDISHRNDEGAPPEVRPPLLLIHTEPDAEHHIQEARDLATAGARLGWKIRFESFARGEHTEAWNVDRARYDRLVRDFLAADDRSG
ncbi:hypothetical protein ABGB18_14165 [Nonomuraea sp. B12E4]|uniref:hypothetical protein n=1 Tax=Nonomuraea sp. B12E4 TaxID=3153564 RepID=UPI00325EBE4D